MAFGGLLLASVGVTGASAYYAEGAAFDLRGAGAAALTRQTNLGELELAIQSALEALEAANDNLGFDLLEVKTFYAERGFAPAWIADGLFTEDARALMARVAAADADGLDPRAYRLPAPTFGTVGRPSLAQVAAVEIQMSLAVAAYVREAYAGRLDPRSLDANLDINVHLPDTTGALVAILAADDPVQVLESYNPQHPGYQALRQQLAMLRNAVPEERIVLPAGPTLRPGELDDRVPLLRARLDVTNPTTPEANPSLYDEVLVAAVRTFQSQVGLTVDGIIGPNTLTALNGPNVDPVAEVIANMERWRWLPRNLGEFHVMVNVPEYMVRIMEQGRVAHETRVVVGQVGHETPIFSDEIETIAVNPYWNVPESIANNELLPQIRSDPNYFVRNAFDIWVHVQGQTYAVTPYQVNWYAVQPGQVTFRQRPGPANALGQIKFLFPNSHNVYLHDTPSRSLFQRDARAFSHGCIRVMNPLEFGDALLAHQPNLTGADIRALIGDAERQVNLPVHIPVHITYFTAVVQNGELQFKPDVYGHSARVRDALNLGGGPVVTAATEPGAAGDLGP
ncbi:MAG: murein L,D-transpeptidase [Bauldia sp.]